MLGALRWGGVQSQRGAVTARAMPRVVLIVLAHWGPGPGIHCCRNSTEQERAVPIATARRGRTPARVRLAATSVAIARLMKVKMDKSAKSHNLEPELPQRIM